MARGTGNGSMKRQAGVAAIFVPLGLALAGCGHRDVVDTPVDWWHHLEGGAIAEQRPPPPGVNDPYPKIGTTPTQPPKVASIELRRSVTADLIAQRNLAERLNAHAPLPPPQAAPPAVNKPAAAPPAPASTAPGTETSSATLDAADAPSGPPARPASGAAAGQKAAKGAPGKNAPARNAGDEPELAMPEVAPPTASQADLNAPTPPIPDAPPAPPALPGLAAPPPPSYAPPPHPNYNLAAAPGEQIQFLPGSDVLANGQGGTLTQIAARRGAGTLFVEGHGEAGSDAVADQAQSLRLAAYRARAVARALEADGVPAQAIRLRADAFGRGATAGLIK